MFTSNFDAPRLLPEKLLREPPAYVEELEKISSRSLTNVLPAPSLFPVENFKADLRKQEVQLTLGRQLLENERLSDSTFIVDGYRQSRLHEKNSANKNDLKSSQEYTNALMSLKEARQLVSGVLHEVARYQKKESAFPALKLLLTAKQLVSVGDERHVRRTMIQLLVHAHEGLEELSTQLSDLESRIQLEVSLLNKGSRTIEASRAWSDSLRKSGEMLWDLANTTDTIRDLLHADSAHYQEIKDAVLLGYLLAPRSFPKIIATVTQTLFDSPKAPEHALLLSELEKINSELSTKVLEILNTAKKASELNRSR